MEPQVLVIGGIVLVVLVAVIAAIIVVGRRRAESKKISFEQRPEEPRELTQEQKSGNYKAAAGFNFTANNAPAAAVTERLTQGPEQHAQPVDAEPAQKPVPKPEEKSDAVSGPDSAPAPERGASTAVEPERESESEPGQDDGYEVGPLAVALGVAAQDKETSRGGEERPSEDGAAEGEAAGSQPQRRAEDESPVEEIDPPAGRLARLRGRLARSQNSIGKSVLGILSAGDLDDEAWEEIEDTLIMADLGATITDKVVEDLRATIAERGVSSEEEARAMLRETLIAAAHPEMDRAIKAMPYDGKPAVVLVVGVNGTGKTTTTGKLARVLVSMGHSVVLGAADTFRAAAADQLETWGRRVGAQTVRGKEGADPASVAYDAVSSGIEAGADVVLVDTAGRLHTAVGLMDQLGKVKRVVEKRAVVDEVLLVLDATVGQNGLVQAKTFRDVVNITGVVLTKLDGSAKGGIVFKVQEELGVPVKLVGLGEGADDLAPFEVESFVDALLGGSS